MIVSNCKICGIEFIGKSSLKIYCSKLCKGRYEYKLNDLNSISLKCKHCDKIFRVKNCRANISKYCSKYCHSKDTLCKEIRTKVCKNNISKSLTGLKRTDETKRKVSLTKIGIKQTQETILKRTSKTTGQKRSMEVKKKMSEAAFKVPLYKRPRGNKCARWKGGITPINEQIRHSNIYKQWRSAVFERDKYTCQMCGQVGRELNADHIKPFSLFVELRFEVSNGRTLCKKCHQQTGTYAGKLKINQFAKSEPKPDDAK